MNSDLSLIKRYLLALGGAEELGRFAATIEGGGEAAQQAVDEISERMREDGWIEEVTCDR